MEDNTEIIDSSTMDDDRSAEGSIEIASFDDDSSSHDDPEQPMSSSEDDTPQLATRESKAIGCFRILVLMALATTAAAVSFFIYNYMRTNESTEFKAAAESHATKLIENFHTALEAKLSAINTLSAAITSYSLDQVQQGQLGLPFVTMPNFAVLAADTRVQAQAVVIVFAPLVKQGQQRQAWEVYAKSNRQHVTTKFFQELAQTSKEDARYNSSGLSLVDMMANFTMPTPKANEEVLSDGFHPRVHYLNGTAVPYNVGDWTMPFWDVSPAVPAVDKLNYDVSSHDIGSGAIRFMHDHQAAVLDLAIESLTNEYDSSGQSTNEYSFMLAMGQYRYQFSEYTNDPLSAVVYPVFDNFDWDSRQIAGILTTNIYWKLFFENSLPENARGIMVVLENTFNQTFTYRVDGLEATFVGAGDWHDTAYDDLGQTANMAEYMQKRSGPSSRSYTAVQLGDYGDYTIHVYPSSDTEADYLTNEPIFYTLLVVAVFLVTSAVFILYDFLVERRQRLVMDNALKSGALISSLFPTNVRDRLYQEAEQALQKKKRSEKEKRAKQKLQKSRAVPGETWPMGSPTDTAGKMERRSSLHRSSAIADRFENSTVLFADLAGYVWVLYIVSTQ